MLAQVEQILIGGLSQTTILQAKRLQIFKEAWVIYHKTPPQKHKTPPQKNEPTWNYPRKKWKNLCLFRGELKHWYVKYVSIRLQQWLEPTLLQTKITSSTTQRCRPYQEEDDTSPQRLELCVTVFKYGSPG